MAIAIRPATEDDRSALAKRGDGFEGTVARSASTFVAVEGEELLGSLKLVPSSAEKSAGGRRPKNLSSVVAGPELLILPLSLAPRAVPEVPGLLLQNVISESEKHGSPILIAWIDPDQSHWIEALKGGGFACVGFDPTRNPSAFCFCRLKQPLLTGRASTVRSLPDVSALIALALKGLGLKPGPATQDGSTHYPLTTEVSISQNTIDEFESGRRAGPPPEAVEMLACERNLGHPNSSSPQFLTAHRDGVITSGLKYVRKTPDRVEVTGGYCNDGVSLGVLLERLLNLSRGRMFSTVEMTVPVTAIEMLATADVLGFVPVAFVPSLAEINHSRTDAVVVVRHLMIEDLEPPKSSGLEAEIAATVLRTIDRQKDSEAIVKLLGDLEVFRGLGREELRRLADLGKQELYSQGKPVFRKGDDGDKAYVVLRGRVEVKMEDQEMALVSFESGRMFGDFALLDGRPRSADAVAEENSILLEIDRRDFRDLIQREPAMGLTIMENLALHIVDRFRRMTKAVEDSGVDLRY
ncbi:MAG: cyclic nucleotide-binding domain-containing protein [Limisphaerales bacterium]